MHSMRGNIFWINNKDYWGHFLQPKPKTFWLKKRNHLKLSIRLETKHWMDHKKISAGYHRAFELTRRSPDYGRPDSAAASSSDFQDSCISDFLPVVFWSFAFFTWRLPWQLYNYLPITHQITSAGGEDITSKWYYIFVIGIHVARCFVYSDCVKRAPFLYFLSSWVALSFKVCPSVRHR